MTSFCRHLGVCGGCSAPHRPYAEQLAAKAQTIRSRLAPVLGSEAAFGGPLFAPPSSSEEPRHFRQKVSFAFAAGPGGELLMGHYARESQRIVPVAECPVHSRRGNRIAFALRDALARWGITAAGRGAHAVLRHVIVRTSADDRDAVAMLVVSRNDRVLRRPIRALLDGADRPDGMFVNVNDRPGPFMVGRETMHVDGRQHVRERMGALSFLISPTAFFQTNVRAACELQDLVMAWLGGAGRVLDLYCGSGLLSLPLAAGGARVVGVEENGQAVADADENRRFNRIPASRARFVAARVEDSAAAPPAGTPDGIVLDPPRQGCSPRVLHQVFRELSPRRVVYVSCNLDALASELPVALDAGYRAVTVRAVDMFPHTDHIETVIVLDRARRERVRAAR